MKLYAWQPRGHGELSWFVMADSEQAALDAINAEMTRRKALPFIDDESIGEYECGGWGTDYYRLTVAGCGEVITNENS